MLCLFFGVADSLDPITSILWCTNLLGFLDPTLAVRAIVLDVGFFSVLQKNSSKNPENAGEIQGDLPEIMVNPSKIMVNPSKIMVNPSKIMVNNSDLP